MENSRKVYVWKILIYFILYSIVGFLIETIYALFTKGMLESRKCFLYGPFCSIYGIAAVCMSIILEKYKNSPVKIYFLGTLIGLTIEYIFSYLGEELFYIRWWDYSQNILNVNGRVCLYYAVIWGFLALFLIYIFHPKIEKKFEFLDTTNSFKTKFIKIIIVITIIFIIIDATISYIVLKNFIKNISFNYNIKIKNFESKKNVDNFFTQNFSHEQIIKNYPNISVITENNEVLYLGSILSEYKNYYYNFKNNLKEEK